MDIKVTSVFEQNWDAWSIPGKRMIVNQGGTRSSKTYSLAQLFAIKLREHANQGIVLTICRKTMPSLKATVMRDFFEIIQGFGWYDPQKHNKTEATYELFGNLVEFVSIDDPQKVHGRKRHWLWANEGNELRYADWKQLIFRTTGKIFLDFNPSDEFHWIYDSVLNREDTHFIKSTYLDNPFLGPEIISEIERLKAEDETYWRVYGLGERGSSGATIYTNWELCDDVAENIDDHVFGLDFGYNVPSSLVYCGFKEYDCYTEEILYKKGMTNADLIKELERIDAERPELDLRNTEIFADAAEPKSIEEIYRAGFNIKPASKAVSHGIKTVKSYKLHITKNSPNLQKEVKYYKFKEDKDGNVLDVPVKFNDHAMDALRYGIHSRDHERKEIKEEYLDWA